MWTTNQSKEGDTRSLKQKVREEMQNARNQVRRTQAERRSSFAGSPSQTKRRQGGAAD